ncbi:hypothetical protein [Rhodovulum strictum]|uniref:Uncharacterized protein n=1 Tax=Rhodovulum strictum TaxID=58314 RepID=A0A844B936_9RHOB|nr:hypothetical protein [Rhodovulum strictum]MRH20924.1 hypothetical protein [Rhodovulum strictum]
MKSLFLCCVLAAASPALSQDWGDLDAALARDLSPGGETLGSYWLPDNADPAEAMRALAVLYAHIPGSASGFTIHAGLYARDAAGLRFAGPVEGLFGAEPRDPVFHAERMELTTSMPGPDDPHCCPSLAQRWSVDYSTRSVTALD